MRLILKSKVKGRLKKVYKNFNQDLFEFLLPPGAELLQYDGSTEGDIVHLKLPLAGEWKSEITSHGSSETTCYFVDEGRKLPFPLKHWKHRHILHKLGPNTLIEDNIEFSSGNKVLDLLIYPGLYLAFAPRVRQYKKYFNSLK